MTGEKLKNAIIGILLLIVAIIVIFQFIGSAAAPLISAGDNVSATGLPLSTLFASNGVVFLVMMAFVLLLVIGSIFAFKGRFT